jgi:acyl dehydratase
MSAGDLLGPVHYALTPTVAAQFARASNLGPAASELLVGDRGQPVAHPVLTQSDYLELLQARYGQLGTGLHTRQRTVVHRPLPLDVELTGRGQVTSLEQKRGRDYWTIDYSVSAGARLLVEHQMTASVDRLDQSQPEPETARRPPAPGTSGAGADWSPATVTFGPDIDRSFTFAGQVAFDRQYWLRYGPSRRTAPNAHTDVEFARAAGLPDAIAHSSHYYAWFAEIALLRFGTRWLYGGTLSARFLGPVFPGDALSLSTAFSDGTNDAVRIRAVNQRGRPISVGEATTAG